MSVQLVGEIGKYFYPNFLQPFLANIDRRTYDDRSRELIPVFQNRKGRDPSSAVARTLERLLGVPPKCRSSEGGRENVYESTSKNTSEYLECSNQVSPKSSPLQGTRTQPLHSGFVGGGGSRTSVTNLVVNLRIRSKWLISPTGLANRLACHIRGVDAQRPRKMG